MTVRKKLAVVLGDHPHDLATIEVRSPAGDFSVQFTSHVRDFEGPVWNIASSPPGAPPEPYLILESGREFWMVSSDAETPDEAVSEFRDLVSKIGGPHTSVRSSHTSEMYRGVGPLIESVKRRFIEAKGR